VPRLASHPDSNNFDRPPSRAAGRQIVVFDPHKADVARILIGQRFERTGQANRASSVRDRRRSLERFRFGGCEQFDDFNHAEGS
jgi:hypothetical protein